MSSYVRLRRFIATYFGSLVELTYKIKFKTIRFNKPPIIILTPGKVGSSSVYYTLKTEIPNHVFHIHNLSKQGIEKSIIDHLNSNRKSYPLHLIISKILRKKLSKYNEKLFIITIIREPISREISSFFQNTELYKDELENKKLEIDKDVAKKLLYKNFDSDICENIKGWFDLEIYNNFGIDVFANKFDYQKKYAVSQNQKYHHMLLKMEDLDTIFPIAIMKFLNLKKPLHIKSANIGETKHYASIYKEVKGNLKLDSNKINQIVNSTFFQQFYLKDKFKVINKWAKE